MNKKVVIALGGNALGKTPSEQKQLVKETARSIVELIQEGYKIVVTHGNGPQVGMINLAFKTAEEHANSNEMPFPECGAMSQGYIGYHLQQAIQMELLKNNLNKDCVTLITQVQVDPKDQAFINPTKPIGSFYTKEEAQKISEEKNFIFKEDAGRGYRRVVPSPKPLKVLELNTIKKLVDDDNIVIACGGGGVPIITDNNEIIGVDAVIDKDKTSAVLATSLNADILLILTAVDYVYINYNKPNQQAITNMTIQEAEEYIADNQFSAGSMLPKIEACNMFLKANKGGQAIITSLTNAKKALKNETGTIIK